MDGKRFDAWLRTAAAPTRRRVLRGLAGGALAAVLGRSAAEDTAAADDARCRNKPLINDRVCPAVDCSQTNPRCE